MRTATRIALVVAPLVVVASLTLVYTHLNIDKRVFVKHLGCGCGPFFNANHLSLTVVSVLLAGTGTSWWIASRGLASRWRLMGVVGFLVLGLAYFRQFMFYNGWL